MKNRLLIILLVLYTPIALAQKTRAQRCAPAESPRQEYVSLVSRYADMEFGVRKAFAYKWADPLGEHYSFISEPGPYACFSYNINFYRRWELYTAAEVYANRPGLKFSYGSRTEGISEKMAPGVIGARLLAGLSYNVRPGWKVTAAPALIFASNWEYAASGEATSIGSTSVVTYRINWRTKEFYDKLYAGLDLQTEHFIYGHLYFSAGVSVEFDSMMPLEGEVEMDTGNGPQTYVANASPYLLNANIGLSFRFLENSNY